jgi:uracil-DNA glycosylase
MLRKLIYGVHPGWKRVLMSILDSMPETEKAIEDKITHDIEIGLDVYPPKDNLFEAFKYFDPVDMKACIIGQDAYPCEGDAHGLCFSVPRSNKYPPSLRNIFAEVRHEFGLERETGNLTDWAEQGVLLLNRALSVRQGNSNSHKKEWYPFTAAVVDWINVNCENVVFLLWGNDARSCAKGIDAEKHHILEHTHPSPLSRNPFVGNGHFKLANAYLIEHNKTEIKWV